MKAEALEADLANLETAVGVGLPKDYRSFLLDHKTVKRYRQSGRIWALAPLKGEEEKGGAGNTLMSAQEVDGKEAPFVSVLQLVAKKLSAVLGAYTSDETGESYGINRLSEGVAIGEAEGDILYLDRLDRFSVWCYHHEGGDVERLAASFPEWLDMATEEKEIAEAAVEIPPPKADNKTESRSSIIQKKLQLAFHAYMREFLIPRGDLDKTAAYADFEKGILKKEYQDAINQIVSRVIRELKQNK